MIFMCVLKVDHDLQVCFGSGHKSDKGASPKSIYVGPPIIMDMILGKDYQNSWLMDLKFYNFLSYISFL